MTAGQHAERAAELLEVWDRNNEAINKMDDHDKLALAARGGAEAIAASQQHTLQAAATYAAVAQALVAVGAS